MAEQLEAAFLGDILDRQHWHFLEHAFAEGASLLHQVHHLAAEVVRQMDALLKDTGAGFRMRFQVPKVGDHIKLRIGYLAFSACIPIQMSPQSVTLKTRHNGEVFVPLNDAGATLRLVQAFWGELARFVKRNAVHPRRQDR